MEEKKDLLDILLDEKEESILFEQIAVIPYNEKYIVF